MSATFGEVIDETIAQFKLGDPDIVGPVIKIGHHIRTEDLGGEMMRPTPEIFIRIKEGDAIAEMSFSLATASYISQYIADAAAKASASVTKEP